MTSELLTVSEAATVAGVTKQTIHNWIAAGKLVAVRSRSPLALGKRSVKKVERAALYAFLERIGLGVVK